MGSHLFVPVLLLAFSSALADFRLTCYPLTPACPGTTLSCECVESEGSLTWIIRSEESSCRIEYFDGNRLGECDNVSTNVSILDTNQDSFSLYNSSLSINLTKNVEVSCKNTHNMQRHNILKLASTYICVSS